MPFFTLGQWALVSSLLISTSSTASLQRRALVTPSNPSGKWTYQGCYTDSTSSRTLNSYVYYSTSSSPMTDELCVSLCAESNFAYAGTEYSRECHCGNSIASGASQYSNAAAACNMACDGNSTEACGGPNALTLYSANQVAVSTPVTDPGPPGWQSLGCYTDSASARALTANGASSGGSSALTVGLCTLACSQEGYSYAGVEYAGQCFCGNSISNGNGLASDPTTCNMACNGNSSEWCGGPNRINVYQLTPSSASSSAPVSSTTSKSTTTASTSSSSATTTTSATTTVSTSASTTKSTTVSTTSSTTKSTTVSTTSSTTKSTTVSTTSSTTTSTTASTTSSTTKLTTTVVSNSSSTTTTTTTKTTSSTSTTTTSTALSTATGTAHTLPNGWTYKGCYIDNADGRIMNNEQPNNSNQTIEGCISTCTGLGYTVAGLEYSEQCFCDNFIRNGGNITTNSNCAMTCSGDSTEICGGPNLVSVYSNGSLETFQPPAAQKTGLPGSWTYQGCLIDNSMNRTFPYQIFNTNNNSANTCLKQCSDFGYMSGGMEYGDECYCGDYSDILNAGLGFAPDSDCNMDCSGNATTICGAGNRISYYNWTGNPITEWNYGSGDSAGIYQFLIGGPIIPLIATVGLNNKVVFMEKFGTEPAHNSTGTYEFDLTAIDNYTLAFRPLHVKTDVFCSAGLTLPDKAGRQINVGGWSDTSTYGIRLYTPSGSAGVWGDTDWEENPDELTLMAGRWYPSTMIMANGSILVVGGEDESNGAPVPSLEILPRPAGVTSTVYCDYLNRTDPNNLYPFLAVLPSGGIFIAYYNEARVLDETSLETIKTLPNIPGAVNNFLAGRSYPMEGTAMLMPQFAPYTEPLTILVCGGSTPYQGIALDNCVSIQPEAETPTWTLERMPSKRVIPCMVALPDGTYLILNGAHQGFAGFGLANDPNRNAVLYDPTRPVGNRMTVLANTTIDRLYHSEGTLLSDGRVLVSGSDPENQNGAYPQEYRLETFTPPYLMGSVVQPTFNIENTDWSYGESVTISNITLHQGTIGGVKVSLMGAVSSTHGNSMGQRTIFPEVSCSGNSCTVVAPPNAHVCPPGWFQLFVMDGSTPSFSQWVRIGGDPAELGNWPDFPDFTRPGV